ncbi:MAG: cation-translocating P-type ATPase [Anaerolineales bacterium]|nr:cation-translocating P-type ATPase [Anaerolineales bacterium]
MAQWHTLSPSETLTQLNTEPVRGLSADEARARLTQHGPNELVETARRNPLRILWEQLTATMVLILLAASGVSFALQKWQEAIAILAIVILFALLGFFQEYRAEQAMAALKKLAVPNVRVRRGGQTLEISARELVPGDIILLEAGNLLSADVRLLEAANLKIQEAALTGESESVEKHTDRLSRPDAPLGDRRNMAYMGTVVTYGRGTAVVTATGMKTELGNIATLLQAVEDEQTPLQRKLDQVGKTLAVAGVLIAIVIAALDLFRPNPAPLGEVLLTAVSVAVAIVPEGLPAVVTITLAIGAQRMLRRNALIRKLPAVETLGSVTVICSDKTGTLTENKMTVTLLDVAGGRVDLTEQVAARHPVILENAGAELPAEHANPLRLLLTGGALCNDALLQPSDDGKSLTTVGDPTEGALLIAAAKFGMRKADLDAAMPRLAELPFDSERKRMTTVHEGGKGKEDLGMLNDGMPYVSITKGSVDGLLDISEQVWNRDHVEALTGEWRRRIEEANTRLAAKGMRVLGVALRPVAIAEPREDGLIFVGLFGMMDPPRAEVADAVRVAKSAGIRPIMITGDHPLTAAHIAKELGIGDALRLRKASAQSAPNPERVLTGIDLNKMSDAELENVVEEVSVFARVSPEHKLKIVAALQNRGEIVAMTGDGVNDAPALKRANIGVAMGITGTDVSKEAAEMVLRDDNFATIVAAVEEGRVIYDNIRKFVKFSIAGNIGKVLVMLISPLLGMPIPLLPLQLLWLNLLTDGLLGIGLGVEPAEKDTMSRKPFTPGESVFSRGLGAHILRTGLVLGLISLAMGFWHWYTGHEDWQTMIFTTLAFSQMWQALGVRSNRESLFKQGVWSNKPLFGLVVLTFGLQMMALYLPGLQAFLKTTTMTAGDLLLCFGVSSLVLVATEVEKVFVRRVTRV